MNHFNAMERVAYIDGKIYALETELALLRTSETLIRQQILAAYAEWDCDVISCHQRIIESAESIMSSTNAEILLRDAVVNDRCNVVLVLLRLGADIRCLDGEERTLLHFCTSARMVDVLLLYGDDNFMFQKSHAGHSALHNISHVDAARRLLEKGLSANVTNNGGCTPMHYVTNPRLIVTLLEFGGDPNHVNYYGHTPLHMAASRGIWEVVYYLLRGGCQVNLCGRDGMSAVTLARMVQSTVLGDIDSKRRSEEGAAVREFRRLEKSIELLSAWQKRVGEGRLCHAEICQAVTKEYSWKCLGLLCRYPRKQLIQTTRIPSEVIDMIVCEYLGPFAAPSRGYRDMSMATYRKLTKEPSAFMRDIFVDGTTFWYGLIVLLCGVATWCMSVYFF